MSEMYSVSPDIRMLVQRVDPGECIIQEEKNKKRDMIPKIIIWNSIVIDDINIYELCVKNGIEFRLYTMNFPSVYHAYSWICSEQLERKDLTNTMRRFLIGYLALSESAIQSNVTDRKLADVPAKKEAIEIIARCYDLSFVCIFNYKRITESILRISDVSLPMADYILNEKLKITAQQIISLASRTAAEITELADELAKCSDEIPRYSDLSKKILKTEQQDRRRKRGIAANTIPEIRNMPKYDPDAELTSLSLTLHSWINSIDRIRNSNIVNSSIKAKNDLYAVLCQLSESVDLLQKHLENSTYEENRLQ